MWMDIWERWSVKILVSHVNYKRTSTEEALDWKLCKTIWTADASQPPSLTSQCSYNRQMKNVTMEANKEVILGQTASTQTFWVSYCCLQISNKQQRPMLRPLPGTIAFWIGGSRLPGSGTRSSNDCTYCYSPWFLGGLYASHPNLHLWAVQE